MPPSLLYKGDNMSKVELAIKFGSNEIIVYRKGFGIMARQLNYVATASNKPNGKIHAYGIQAKRLCELKSQYQLHQPIQGIDISNAKLAEALLNNIIEEALFESCNITALVAVPCALTENKLLELKMLLHNVGISRVTFVQNSVCVRANLAQLDDNATSMIVDMGKYLVDMSVLSRYNFVAGRDYLIGGKDMDDALKVYVQDNYEATITNEQAESVKDEVASMYENDMYTVTFKGVFNGEYKEVTIRANECRVAIVGVYEKIFDLIEEFIETLPETAMAEIRKNGIMFMGGVSSINGFAEYANKRLNISSFVLGNPKDAVILGAGKLLSLNKQEFPHIKL